MKKYIIVCWIAGAIAIAACSVTQHLQPSNGDLAQAQKRIPGITISQLNDGYNLYVTNCSGCHRLHYPNEYSAENWNPILLSMFGKAKLSDDKQKLLISNYLIAKSK